MEWKVKSRARASGEEQYAGHGMHDGNAYAAQYVCRTHLSMGRVESDCLGVWVSTLAPYNIQPNSMSSPPRLQGGPG